MTKKNVEFRSRGGAEGESERVQEESHLCLSNFFKAREATESLQATAGCLPLSIKPCVKSTCTCSVIAKKKGI